MAVRMRLRREGKRKQPFYRVVVADARSPRDGRFIEDIGYYQPLREPSRIEIKRERALYWLGEGVQPSDAVRQLLRVSGIWEEFRPGDVGRQRVTAAQASAAAGSSATAAQDTPTAEDTAPAAQGDDAVATAPDTAQPEPEAAADAASAGQGDDAADAGADTAQPEAAADAAPDDDDEATSS